MAKTTVLKFAKGSDAATYLREGWSYPEDSFTWSDGYHSKIAIPLDGKSRPVSMALEMAPFLAPPTLIGQSIHLFADGRHAFFGVSKGPEPLSATMLLPRGEPEARLLELSFAFPNASIPAEVQKGSKEQRRLAFGLRTITLQFG